LLFSYCFPIFEADLWEANGKQQKGYSPDNQAKGRVGERLYSNNDI
jgi:hypothetical protein